MKQIVVLEGADGVGKTTVCKEISKATGHEYIKTPSGVYGLLKPHFDLPDADFMARFFFYCAGVHESSELIRQMIAQGKNVVVDRFIDSLELYHSELTGTDLKGKTDGFGFMKPDLVIILTADPDVLEERRQKDNRENTCDVRLETNSELMARIAERYKSYTPNSPYVKIDTNRITIDEVTQRCLQQI